MKKFIFIFPILFLFIGCVTTPSYTLNPPTVIKHGNIREYKYVYIKPTVSVNSSVATGYDIYYSAEEKNVNPKDIISGCLIKYGYIILDEIPTDKDCLVVTYGESGRRYVSNYSYTTEVTIQFVSSKTKDLIVTTTAEGIGRTEVDDIKIAIQRAVEALFQ